MRTALGREFDKHVRWIRKAFPPKDNVQISVRTIKRLKNAGEAVHSPTRTVIRINRSGPLATATDTLLHEWAHMKQLEVERFNPDPSKQHSPRWGLIFSEIYRAYLKEFS